MYFRVVSGITLQREGRIGVLMCENNKNSALLFNSAATEVLVNVCTVLEGVGV